MANKNNNKTNNQSVNNQSVDNQSVDNQSANALQYVTYKSKKSGKTIPVVIGFTGKDDERLPYIAVLEQPKAKKGKKAKKLHGPAYATYSVLPLGKDGERIPCAIWGADPRWHDIAKLAATTINDLDALTQEAYDDLCAKAKAVYEAKKAEGLFNEKENGKEQPAKVQPKGKVKNSKGEKGKVKNGQSSMVNGQSSTVNGQSETTLSATKPAATYTEAALMAAFAKVAKAAKLPEEGRQNLEKFMKTVIAAAA